VLLVRSTGHWTDTGRLSLDTPASVCVCVADDVRDREAKYDVMTSRLQRQTNTATYRQTDRQTLRTKWSNSKRSSELF